MPRNDYVYYNDTGDIVSDDGGICGQRVALLHDLFKVDVSGKTYRLALLELFETLPKPDQDGALPRICQLLPTPLHSLPIGMIVRCANVVRVPTEIWRGRTTYIVNTRVDLETFNSIY